jgi:hypothetical protein
MAVGLALAARTQMLSFSTDAGIATRICKCWETISPVCWSKHVNHPGCIRILTTVVVARGDGKTGSKFPVPLFLSVVRHRIEEFESEDCG